MSDPSHSSPQVPAARPVRFGTMGWSYDDWRGSFYQSDLPQARMLEQYASQFSTVELDTTFYGAPRPSTLDTWAAATPETFLFSAKVPRHVSHERRLRHAAEAALGFGGLLRQRLGARLGALLLQLPPDFNVEERPALESFLESVVQSREERGLPWVVEFRDASWRETDILAWLEERGVAVATTERLDHGGELRYLRLLGVENSVARFDARQFDRGAELDSWAERIRQAAAVPLPFPVLVYARNFFEGHAPATLAELRRRLGLAVPTPPGQQQMRLF